MLMLQRSKTGFLFPGCFNRRAADLMLQRNMEFGSAISKPEKKIAGQVSLARQLPIRHLRSRKPDRLCFGGSGSPLSR